MKISVGITTYNSLPFLKKSLYSLPQSADVEIIVYDDGSTDGTKEFIQENFPHIKYFRGDENKGTVYGRKHVLQKARGDYFFRLDADAYVQENALVILADFLDKNPKAGVVGPKILYPDGTPDYTSYSTKRIGALRIFLDYSFIVWKALKAVLRRFLPQIKSRIPKAPIQVDHVLGAAFMVRKEAIQDAGPLDEGIVHYREETNWLYDMAKKRWEVWYEPHAVVIHDGGSSTTQVENVYIHGRNRQLKSLWKFIHNHYPGTLNAFLFFIAVILGSVVSLIFGLLLLPFALFHHKIRLVVKRIFNTFGGVLIWHAKNMKVVVSN